MSYLGKRKIFNLQQYEQDRKRLLDVKINTVWLAFSELEGLVNVAAIARQYFKRSPGWLSQKINACTVANKQKRFTETEYHQLAEAFRDIAKRLEAHADEIDAAEMESDDDE